MVVKLAISDALARRGGAPSNERRQVVTDAQGFGKFYGDLTTPFCECFVIWPSVDEDLQAPKHVVDRALPYRKSKLRVFLFWLFTICTAGAFYIVMNWFSTSKEIFRRKRVKDVKQADSFVFVSQTGRKRLVDASTVRLPRQEYHLYLLNVREQLELYNRRCLVVKGKVPLPVVEVPPASAFVDTNVTIEADGRATEVFVVSYQCRRFVMDARLGLFVPLAFPAAVTPDFLVELYISGISDPTVRKVRRKLYGPSCVEPPVPSLFHFCFDEVFHPFYVFQMASIALWLWDEYYQYAGAIIVITVVSLLIELITSRRSQMKLRSMARVVCDVSVLTRAPVSGVPLVVETRDSRKLVPGDLILLKREMVLPCDCILFGGQAVVNESMLTGESVPVIKSPLTSSTDVADDKGSRSRLFNVAKDYSSVLFGGTEVIEVRRSCRNDGGESSGATLQPAADMVNGEPVALVIRTGFDTAQGRMVRSIIQPTHTTGSSYKRETYLFLGFLSVLGSIGAVIALIVSLQKHLERDVVIIRFFDTFTNAIPPALSAAMAAGVSIAVGRLRKLCKIVCISPSKIVVSGQVNTFVFDKTGTLTEDGLTMEGAVCIEDVRLSGRAEEPVYFGDLKRHSSALPYCVKLGMAACHSLSVVNDTIIGEPLELQMQKHTGWTFTEEERLAAGKNSGIISLSIPPPGDCVGNDRMAKYFGTAPTAGYETIARHEFLPALQRMSVVVREVRGDSASAERTGGQSYVLCKGSPEVIQSLCIPETVPADFEEVLLKFAESGKRVLALAFKPLNRGSVLESVRYRSEAESGLFMLAFLVFANDLKPSTLEAIQAMTDAGCHCVMATGDNPLTAAAVAQASGIIPQRCSMVFFGDLKVCSGPAVANVCDGGSEAYNPTGAVGLDRSAGECRLLWTTAMYQPTCDSLGVNGDSSENLSETDVSMEVTVSLKGATQDRNSCYSGADASVLTTRELLERLADKDPRELALVLTGRAFRYLREQAEVDAGNESQEWQFGDPSLVEPQVRVHAKVLGAKGRRKHLNNNNNNNNNKVQAAEDRSARKDLELGEEKLWTGPASGSVVTLSMFEFVLRYCHVFSRMTPDDKVGLVLGLQELPEAPVVGMCGDGANDCGALRAADVGVSLSEKEASIAAPFTSSEKTIESCVDVCREGRAALVNSFQNFKYVTMYAMIQLSSTVMLYTFGTNLTDSQYLWIDLVTILPLSLTMAWTGTDETLTKRLPQHRLLGPPVLASLLGLAFIQILFFVLAYVMISKKSFFVPFDPTGGGERFDDDDLQSYENTAIFLVSNVQYWFINLLFAGGRPWRKFFVTNYVHCGVLLFLAVCAVLFVVLPPSSFGALSAWLMIMYLPKSFRLQLLGWIALNCIVSAVYELYFVDRVFSRSTETKEYSKHHVSKLLPGSAPEEQRILRS